MHKQEEIKKVDIPITGMTCAACAKRIEKKLSKVDGVAQTGVNFATATATVEYDPSKVTLQTFITAIKDIGFGIAGSSTLLMKVESMPEPYDKFSPTLTSIFGVLDISADISSKVIKVNYLSEILEARDLMDKATEIVKAFGSTLVSNQQEEGETLQEQQDLEYKALKQKFLFAILFSFPVFIIAMSHGQVSFLNFEGINWVQFLLTTIVLIYCGQQFYWKAIIALKNLAADMNTLVATGTASAYIYSTLLLFFPTIFSIHKNHIPDLYFEAASMIITLLL
ncbi:MAG: cation transporter, partial [Blastocatellia bacterium]|nr:cation transporter [Blastocatellia bacterium]